MKYPVRAISVIENNITWFIGSINTLPLTEPTVAAVVHLYYLDIWEEMRARLVNIPKLDLYITLVEGSAPAEELVKMENEIMFQFPSAKVFHIENKGLDIGGFLNIADYLIKNNLHYDFLVKLHSKKSLHTADVDTGVTWRTEAYNTLAGSPAIAKGVIKLMTAHPEIGMVGSAIWNIYSKTNQLMGYGHNYMTIKNLVKDFGLKTDIDNFNFIAGTMFWANYESLMKPLRGIDIPAFIARMEPGACDDSRKSTITHSMERILALFIAADKKRIVGI